MLQESNFEYEDDSHVVLTAFNAKLIYLHTFLGLVESLFTPAASPIALLQLFVPFRHLSSHNKNWRGK